MPSMKEKTPARAQASWMGRAALLTSGLPTNPTEIFVEKVEEEKPQLVGLSALLTTTLARQREVIEALGAAGLRDDVKVIIGGAPVSQSWAEKIGADACAEDAFSGMRKAEKLLSLNSLPTGSGPTA